MAARLDLFAGTEDGKGASTLAGFVSASDGDEQSLFELLNELASRTVLDAKGHGSGRVAAAALPALVVELQELVDQHGLQSDELMQQWAREILETVASIEKSGATLAWHMRYDVGGSTDDGPDEFPTSWSGAGA